MVEAGAAAPDEAQDRVREAKECVETAAMRLIDLLGLQEVRPSRALTVEFVWARRTADRVGSGKLRVQPGPGP